MFQFLFPEHRRGSACTYYRQEIPARTMWDLRLARTGICQAQDMGFTPQDRLKYYLKNDAVFYYAMSSPDLIKLVRKLRKFGAETHEDGSISVPPVFFGDMDDNIHHVNPLNPKFRDLGTRDETGKLYEKGAEVYITDEQGQNHLLWKEGDVGGEDVVEDRRRLNKRWVWDVERAQERVKIIDKLWKIVDGMSFSTPRLEAYYKKALKLKNTYTFYNSVRFDDYPNIPINKEKGTVKILWQGGDAHYGDWYGLRPVLPWTCSQFQEVRWVIFGSIYKFIHKTIPRDRLLYIDWVPYDAYKTRLSTIDFDFMVAPLAPNIFNECKSAIKWYEISALPNPKPILAANTPPFSDEIIDGETGFLYSTLDEFKTKFEALVRDEKLRDRLAMNAKQWMAENRDVRVTVPKYMEWVVKTIDATRKKRWPAAWADAGLSK